ncbi:thioesterase [Mycobacterium haemophilum DSM 44634]
MELAAIEVLSEAHHMLGAAASQGPTKAYARGYLSDAAGITVEAGGVFIEPAWAREVE